jgi:hypothetical protein
VARNTTPARTPVPLRQRLHLRPWLLQRLRLLLLQCQRLPPRSDLRLFFMTPWQRNLLYVSRGLLAWLGITVLAVWPVAHAQISTQQFVWATQMAPLLYLLIVVVYGVCMNRGAAPPEQPDSRP